MVLLFLIAALAVVVPAVAGPWVAYGPGRRVATGRIGVVTGEAVGGLVRALGRPGSAVIVLFTFAAAVIAVFWPLGELAHALEHAVDWPVLNWVAPRREPTFEHVNSFYTALGDRTPLKWVTGVAAVLFAVLWRRRFWIPLIAIPGAFVLEQYVQAIVGGMVHRGHPPTGLGTYPSGGVARIWLTVGAVALFAALTWKLATRWTVTLFTVVLVLATLEGYSRIYVQKHWLTDVISGLFFGPALFLGYALAVCVLAGRYPGPERPADREPAPAYATESAS